MDLKLAFGKPHRMFERVCIDHASCELLRRMFRIMKEKGGSRGLRAALFLCFLRFLLGCLLLGHYLSTPIQISWCSSQFPLSHSFSSLSFALEQHCTCCVLKNSLKAMRTAYMCFVSRMKQKNPFLGKMVKSVPFFALCAIMTNRGVFS